MTFIDHIVIIQLNDRDTPFYSDPINITSIDFLYMTQKKGDRETRRPSYPKRRGSRSPPHSGDTACVALIAVHFNKKNSNKQNFKLIHCIAIKHCFLYVIIIVSFYKWFIVVVLLVWILIIKKCSYIYIVCLHYIVFFSKMHSIYNIDSIYNMLLSYRFFHSCCYEH